MNEFILNFEQTYIICNGVNEIKFDDESPFYIQELENYYELYVGEKPINEIVCDDNKIIEITRYVNKLVNMSERIKNREIFRINVQFSSTDFLFSFYKIIEEVSYFTNFLIYNRHFCNIYKRKINELENTLNDSTKNIIYNKKIVSYIHNRLLCIKNRLKNIL